VAVDGRVGSRADVTQASALALERLAYRQSRARRSTLAAVASTLVFAGAVGFGITRTPGWARVQETFFSPAAAWSALPSVLEGLWLNIRVLVVAEIGILVLGLLIATLRTLRGPVFFPVRALATGYVDLFRGMPLLIALYLIGFGVPALRLQGVPSDVAVLGTVTLILVYSAYVAEVFRAGIESVHPSQRAAARSLGLTHRQSMRLVILPQAVRRVLPPLLNDFVALQKDVGLISVLGAVDAIRAAQIEAARTFNFTPYVLAGLLFVLLAVPTGRIADALAARAARRQGLA
jgi:polar amino acid transport system permease protein